MNEESTTTSKRTYLIILFLVLLMVAMFAVAFLLGRTISGINLASPESTQEYLNSEVVTNFNKDGVEEKNVYVSIFSPLFSQDLEGKRYGIEYNYEDADGNGSIILDINLSSATPLSGYGELAATFEDGEAKVALSLQYIMKDDDIYVQITPELTKLESEETAWIRLSQSEILDLVAEFTGYDFSQTISEGIENVTEYVEQLSTTGIFSGAEVVSGDIFSRSSSKCLQLDLFSESRKDTLDRAEAILCGESSSEVDYVRFFTELSGFEDSLAISVFKELATKQLEVPTDFIDFSELQSLLEN